MQTMELFFSYLIHCKFTILVLNVKISDENKCTVESLYGQNKSMTLSEPERDEVKMMVMQNTSKFPESKTIAHGQA